jgi:arginyl-tRNA--protein-N-Asp/Glu arginylyltransferase
VTDPGSSADPRARLAALVDSLGLAPSPPSPCPYLPGRDSRLVAVNPERLSPGVYRLFLDLNFRRLGSVVYRPACDGCRECRQLRVDAARFRPTRAQRRCLRQNADVSVRSGWPEPTAEKHEVYRRYLDARHDGQMSGSWGEFQDFLHEAPPFTREVVFRVGERLLGAGIYDAVPGALSAVYFYFDPDLGSRSPGTLNVLWLVEECRRLGFPWLYLGYHVPGSPSMSYKARFFPHEILFDDGQWR